MCTNAIAIFDNKHIKGNIKFHECENSKGTEVHFNLYNLKPNKVAGFHIHENGDITEGCKSLGPHFNPTNKQHGSIFIDIKNSHSGDLLNNVYPDKYGKFIYSYIDPRIKLRGDVESSIFGRAIVLHEGEDDLGLGKNKDSKITGNSGERIGYALIGHTKKF
jgi:Cu-Zn family superoxide dismutase